MKKQLAIRPTSYLLGELDILPLYGFDASCAAMAQGPTRLARGAAWGKYVNEKYGAQHKTLVVPACGHNARCIFTADAVLPLIFPKPGWILTLMPTPIPFFGNGLIPRRVVQPGRGLVRLVNAVVRFYFGLDQRTCSLTDRWIR